MTQPNVGKLVQPVVRPAKVGAIDLFRAPVNTLYNAATGWIYLGRIKKGSYKNEFNRKFYDLMTGTTETIKETFVTGVEGKMEAALIEPTSMAYMTAAGNGKRIAGYGTVPVSGALHASTPATTTVLTLVAADGAKFPINTEIEVDFGGTIGKQYTYVIASPSTDAVEVYPPLPGVAPSGSVVKKVVSWEFGMGGTDVEYIALRAVFHTTDGDQIVTWAPKVRCDGVRDDFKDANSEAEVPLAFTMFGFADPAYNGPIVAKKFLLTASEALTY